MLCLRNQRTRLRPCQRACMKKAPVCKAPTPAVDKARASRRAPMSARADEEAPIEWDEWSKRMKNK